MLCNARCLLLSLSPLSVSVFFLFSLPLSSLCLCLRVLLWLCVVGVVCCVLFALSCVAVWCVCVPVCAFYTSPCMPAPRAHVETHLRVVPAYTETFWTDTRSAWVRGGSCRQPRVFHRKNQCFLNMFSSTLTQCQIHASSPIFCLPRLVHVVITCSRG